MGIIIEILKGLLFMFIGFTLAVIVIGGSRNEK